MIFHKNFLADELTKWREDGLISDEAARKIAARYDMDLPGANERRSFKARSVSVFGAFAIYVSGRKLGGAAARREANHRAWHTRGGKF